MAKLSSSKTLTRILKIAGTLLSTGLFLWLLSKQDWVLIWFHLRQLPVWLWPFCLALVVIGMLCNAWRWYILLKAQSIPVPFIEVVKTIFAGAFASNFLPSTIGGDAFRILSLLRFTPSRTLSVASVVVDRALNVIAMLSFLPFAWLSFGPSFLASHHELTAVSWLGGVRGVKARGFFSRVKARLVEAFSVWMHRPGSLVLAWLVSLLSIIVVFAAVWIIARGLGIPVAFTQVMGVSVITYLVILLPVSLNGYGLREVTVTTLYIALGATPEQAATLALITRAFMLIETLPGALWLSQILSGNSIRQSFEAQQEER